MASRVVLCREAGGLGDVLRAMAPARTIAAHGVTVDAVVLRGYAHVASRVQGISQVRSVAADVRRGRDAPPKPEDWPYLANGGIADAYYDMYCPGWRHEVATKGAPMLDRTECFFMSAGLDPVAAEASVIPVTREEYGWGRGFLARGGVDTRRPVVGLQPFGTDKPRNWNSENWRVLAKALKKTGYSPVVFGTRRFQKSPVPEMFQLRPSALILTVSALDLFIGPDSGLVHLASALQVPAVGIYGPTRGDLICKHYPLATALQGSPAASGRCKAPCHYQGCRGFSKELCRGKGCPVVNSVPVEAAFRTAQSVLDATPSRGQAGRLP